MTTVKVEGRWLLGLFVLACALSACVARLNEMGAPASQAEQQVVTPQPATVQPAESPTEASVIITEIVTEPASDPIAATLTAFPIPATPTPIGYDPPEGPTPLPTPTMSRVVNMAEGIAPEETMYYIVRRADGSYEKYLVPVAILPTDETYRSFRDQLLSLGPQDALIDAAPVDMRPMEAPQVATQAPSD